MHQLEVNVVLLGCGPPSEGLMEYEADFIPLDNMDMTYMPMPFWLSLFPDKDSVTCKKSDQWELNAVMWEVCVYWWEY